MFNISFHSLTSFNHEVKLIAFPYEYGRGQTHIFSMNDFGRLGPASAEMELNVDDEIISKRAAA